MAFGPPRSLHANDHEHFCSPLASLFHLPINIFKGVCVSRVLKQIPVRGNLDSLYSQVVQNGAIGLLPIKAQVHGMLLGKVHSPRYVLYVRSAPDKKVYETRTKSHEHCQERIFQNLLFHRSARRASPPPIRSIATSFPAKELLDTSSRKMWGNFQESRAANTNRNTCCRPWSAFTKGSMARGTRNKAALREISPKAPLACPTRKIAYFPGISQKEIPEPRCPLPNNSLRTSC